MTLKNRVKSIIDEWDPIGLLKMGAPDDEYHSEIDDIIIMVCHTADAEELAKEIQTILIKSFGLTYDTEQQIEKERRQCLDIAMKIMEIKDIQSFRQMCGGIM